MVVCICRDVCLLWLLESLLVGEAALLEGKWAWSGVETLCGPQSTTGLCVGGHLKVPGLQAPLGW